MKERVEAERRGFSNFSNMGMNEERAISNKNERNGNVGIVRSGGMWDEGGAEARIAKIRADRETKKQKEIEDQEEQLKIAHQANRQARLDMKKGLAFDVAIAPPSSSSASPIIMSENAKGIRGSNNTKPSSRSRRSPSPDQFRIASGVIQRDDSKILNRASLDGIFEENDDVAEAATIKKFHGNNPSQSQSPGRVIKVLGYDRAHLDDVIQEGDDAVVLKKLHDRRARENQARENARLVFRKLQDQRKNQVDKVVDQNNEKHTAAAAANNNNDKNAAAAVFHQSLKSSGTLLDVKIDFLEQHDENSVIDGGVADMQHMLAKALLDDDDD